MISFVADSHFNNWLNFSTYEDSNNRNINSRLMDCIRAFQKMIRISIKNDSKLIVFLGDLFELRNKLDAELFNLVWDEFRKCPIEIVMVPGNHDYSTKSTDVLRSNLYSLAAFDHVGIASKPYLHKHPGIDVSLHLIPYYDAQKDHLEHIHNAMKAAENAGGINILCTHAEVRGGKMGRTKSKKGIPLKKLGLDVFDHIFLGHFHNHQVIAEKVVYVGATLQHTFSDVGQKRGFVLYDEKTNTWEHKPIKSPKFQVTSSIKKAVKLDAKGHFVRFKPKNEKDYTQMQSLIEEDGLRVQLDACPNSLNVNFDSLGEGGMTAEGLVETWVKETVPKKALRKKLIDAGLKYLG